MLNRINTRLLVAAAALLMAPASWGALAPYSQNFEALLITSPTVLGTTVVGSAGFRVFGTVFNGDTVLTPPYGAIKYNYGAFSAPNGTPAFSSIATGEGGGPQGSQYLNIYSDYDCCAPIGIVTQGHKDSSDPFDYVQSTVFQEQAISLANIGQVWTLTFDAKQPAANGCGTNAVSDCIAFIKTLNPLAGYATTNLVTIDAQTLSSVDWSTHVLVIDLSDPALNGQILQFGFASTSQKYGNTGVFYDNIVFALAPDTDSDGLADPIDNCTGVANNEAGTVPNSPGVLKSQLDADQDGYGNACDGDLNNSSLTTAQDNTILRNVLNSAYNASANAAKSDLNGSGLVTAQDNTILRNRLNTVPGPSGLACAGTIPCPP